MAAGAACRLPVTSGLTPCAIEPCSPQTNLVLCSPETTVADAAKLLDGPPSIEARVAPTVAVTEGSPSAARPAGGPGLRNANCGSALPLPPSRMQGLPVVDATKKLVGVLSRKDLRTKTGATVAVSSDLCQPGNETGQLRAERQLCSSRPPAHCKRPVALFCRTSCWLRPLL